MERCSWSLQCRPTSFRKPYFIKKYFLQRSHRVSFLRGYSNSSQNSTALTRKEYSVVCPFFYRSKPNRYLCGRRRGYRSKSAMFYSERKSSATFVICFRLLLSDGRYYWRGVEAFAQV